MLLWPEGPAHRSSNHKTNRELAETPNDEIGSRKERPRLILWAPPPGRNWRGTRALSSVVTIQGVWQHGRSIHGLEDAYQLFLNRKDRAAASSSSGKCRLSGVS